MDRELVGLLSLLGLVATAICLSLTGPLRHHSSEESLAVIEQPLSMFQDPQLLLRTIRRQPHLYSLLCKAALFYSRNIASSAEKRAFCNEKALFSLDALEARHCDELKQTGITILHGFFDTELTDLIYAEADHLFRNLRLDFVAGYSVQDKKLPSLKGITYEALESTEKVIFLEAPLRNIPACIPFAFNETILKIVTNFLGCIPPHFAVSIIRDFPHDRPKEASNFHKDFDDADSVAAFVYLVDTDVDTSGSFVYVPFSNRYDTRSCKPRLSRDSGSNANDGRMSDGEVEKHYPRKTWVTVRAKRGSVVIFHGNGIHKGPSWKHYGDAGNRPRTAIRLSFGGFKLKDSIRRTGVRVAEEDYQRLSRLQRLFIEGQSVTSR
jgi:hypothetical protein